MGARYIQISSQLPVHIITSKSDSANVNRAMEAGEKKKRCPILCGIKTAFMWMRCGCLQQIEHSRLIRNAKHVTCDDFKCIALFTCETALRIQCIEFITLTNYLTRWYEIRWSILITDASCSSYDLIHGMAQSNNASLDEKSRYACACVCLCERPHRLRGNCNRGDGSPSDREKNKSWCARVHFYISFTHMANMLGGYLRGTSCACHYHNRNTSHA